MCPDCPVPSPSPPSPTVGPERSLPAAAAPGCTGNAHPRPRDPTTNARRGAARVRALPRGSHRRSPGAQDWTCSGGDQRHALPLRRGGAARGGRRAARAAARGIAAGAGPLGATRGRATQARGHRGGGGRAGAAGARPVARRSGAGARRGGGRRPGGHVLVQVPAARAGRRAALGRYCAPLASAVLPGPCLWACAPQLPRAPCSSPVRPADSPCTPAAVLRPAPCSTPVHPGRCLHPAAPPVHPDRCLGSRAPHCPACSPLPHPAAPRSPHAALGRLD